MGPITNIGINAFLVVRAGFRFFNPESVLISPDKGAKEK